MASHPFDIENVDPLLQQRSLLAPQGFALEKGAGGGKAGGREQRQLSREPLSDVTSRHVTASNMQGLLPAEVSHGRGGNGVGWEHVDLHLCRRSVPSESGFLHSAPT